MNPNDAGAERAPHVAYLGHSAAMSGAEIALLRLLEAQSAQRATVVLAEDGPLVARLREVGADVIVLPLPNTAAVQRTMVAPGRLPVDAVVASVAYTVRVARLLRRIRPDVVHTNSMKAHLYGGVAARLAGVPQVWHARDRAADDYLPRPAVRLVQAAARTLPAMVIANSAATLATYPGVRSAAVVHDAAPAHIRRAPAPDGPLRVGMVGRLAPWKGQDVFLRAFAAAFGNGDQQAVVVGDALFGEHEYADSLRRQAASLGIAERVEFAGFVDDVAERLDDMHVLVHCSTTPEPFGQVVVEGMAAGLPVIASAVGGPSEVIADGSTGLLVAPRNVEQLRDALCQLDSDAALRQRLGQAAAIASATFRPERVAAQITAIHRRLATDPKGARMTTDVASAPTLVDVRTAPVSVVICTRNEEQLIERVIRSVAFADEVLVCDSGSTDATVERASAAGAGIIEQEWLGFSQQKNHAASLATHDWILSLDADEVVTPAMAAAIIDALGTRPDATTGFAVDRRGIFFGAELPNLERRSTRATCVRLYNRTHSGWDEQMSIHEVVRVPGEIRMLDGHLRHRRMLSMDDFFTVFNRNATIEAGDVLAQRPRVRALQVLTRPILRFLWCYVIRGEFRLGERGLVHACVAASSDLMRYAKAWERSRTATDAS